MNLICFYHVWQIPGWELLYQQQIMALYTSGLYNHLKTIYVCCNGKENLPFETPKIIQRYNNNHTNESDTLHSMWQFSNVNKSAKILYLHTKGISYQLHPLRKNIDAWRLYLEFYNIYKWKDCVEKLNEYDIVGTEWTSVATNYVAKDKQINLPNNAGIYLGNFWWANANYISSLNKDYLFDYSASHKIEGIDIEEKYNPSEEDKSQILRHNSELWLGTNLPKKFNFRNLNETYLEITPQENSDPIFKFLNKKYNVGYETNALNCLETFL